MKQLTNYKSKVAAAIVASFASTIFVLPRAVQYTLAARRDERKGFTYTAAMEWRHAAELFDPNTVSADYYWRQWERLIRLPRRLAGTICEPPFASCRLQIINNTVAYNMPLSSSVKRGHDSRQLRCIHMHLPTPAISSFHNPLTL